jgi:hypothetical protein
VLVGDQAGQVLAELEPQLVGVAWRLNDYGMVKFALGRDDAKLDERFLEYGNRVLIQFDNGLPDWGGVIDPPRSWRGQGVVEITAYGGEYLLGFRTTDRGRYFDQATAGAIFRAVIEESGVEVEIGQVWNGGTLHSPAYHFESVLEIVRDSICERLSEADFAVRGSLVDGVITLTADLYEQRGGVRQAALVEGANVVAMQLVEQGPIWNEVTAVGAGSGWGADRPMATASDGESSGRYMLRQKAEIMQSVVIQTTLESAAGRRLGELGTPRRLYDVVAADLAPGRFGEYGIGDWVRLMAPSFGFGGTDTVVRVLAREWDAGTGFCRLVVG